jgi:hypothetical protein
MSDDGDDLAALIGQRFKAATTVPERRAREARSISRSARGRHGKGRVKTEQLNMRVSPAFKKLVAGLAHDRGVSIVELIELAVEQMQGAPHEAAP